MRFPTMPIDGIRRPIIALHVESPGGKRILIDALVDTGSDLTLLPDDVARVLDIDLSHVPTCEIFSALGTRGLYKPFDLILELRRIPEVSRWNASVGFLARPMAYAILGTKGFFEHFSVSYNSRLGMIDITPIGP
jgi:hypothetical protein